jgi:hypothetical protein
LSKSPSSALRAFSPFAEPRVPSPSSQAGHYGGVTLLHNSTLYASGCTWRNNSLLVPHPTNTDGPGANTSEISGAALLVNNVSRAEVTGSWFMNNSLVGFRKLGYNKAEMNGGVVCVKSQSQASFTNVKFLINKIIADNNKARAMGIGGAVTVAVQSKATFTSCDFTGNAILMNGTRFETESHGGALASLEGSEGLIKGSRFFKNRAINSGNKGTGGAITAYQAGSINITSTSFILNSLRLGAWGGGMGGGALAFMMVPRLTLDRPTFQNNNVTRADGRVIMATGVGTLLTIYFADFIGVMGPPGDDITLASGARLSECTLAQYSLMGRISVSGGGACTVVTTAPTAAPTQMPTVYVPYPRLRLSVNATTATTVLLSVKMADPGYLYCLVQGRGEPRPTGATIKANVSMPR